MSIIQLKFAIFDIDFYNRIFDNESFSIKKQRFTISNDFAFYYEIEKLLNKRISREQSQYLIK